MSNDWLRLWHDLPNDPKWRTIAKISKQHVTSVISVYIHLLVSASTATDRGRPQSFCSEDVASGLDLKTEQITSILAAMEGRVIQDGRLSGWEKRQPNREDGSAERSKTRREKIKLEKELQQLKEKISTLDGSVSENQENKPKPQPTATDRNRPIDTDTDTDTEEIISLLENTNVFSKSSPPSLGEKISDFEIFWESYPKSGKGCGKVEAGKAYQKAIRGGVGHAEILAAVKPYASYLEQTGISAAYASKWLKDQRWNVDYNGISITSDEKKEGVALTDTERYDLLKRLIDKGSDRFVTKNDREFMENFKNAEKYETSTNR